MIINHGFHCLCVELTANVGQFRLVNGSSHFEGRLEFKFTEEVNWRAITASNVRVEHMPVLEQVCQHLGFKTFLTYYKWSKFGRSDGLPHQFYHWSKNDVRPSSTEDNAEHLGLMCTSSKNGSIF